MPKNTIFTEAEIKAYKKLQDNMNRRLRRIRQYMKEPGYKGITEYAYKNAMEDIRRFFGPGKRGYSKALPTGKGAREQYKAIMNSMTRFKEAATSTIGGIHKTYKQRAETLNKKYGWDLSWRDLAKLFESGMWKKFKSSGYDYASDQTFKAIATFIDNKKDILKAKNSIDISWSEDPMENAFMQGMMDEYAADIKKFLRKI